MWPPRNESDLLASALALGAHDVAGWSAEEEALCANLRPASDAVANRLRGIIAAGDDPLGAAFCALRTPAVRRSQGATYTPQSIVQAMVAWARNEAHPERIVDPGVGSGRFIVAAGRALPDARLIGIDLDPVAAVIARGHIAAANLARRAEVRLGDYREAKLPAITGQTLYIGNPPYVRHHLIDSMWKSWLSREAARLGFRASQLAGMHVHFYLATAMSGRAGDRVCFITAAEWLDVNYGQIVRDLFVGPLGGLSLHVVEPTAEPFPDAQATAAIGCFRLGARPTSVYIRRVSRLDDLGALNDGAPVARERLAAATRWTPLARGTRTMPEGFVELGELCRVHRGAVTGANKVWIAGAHSKGLPECVLFPSVTKAKDLFSAGPRLCDRDRLRRVIDIPADLDVLDEESRRSVEAFLKVAKAMGADAGYVARQRRAWWSVGLRTPAPILATYMARRPPAFVQNIASARHINIAHGVYPRDPLPERAIERLAAYLSASVQLTEGRTYAGGLTKFEPREMERLLIPDPATLARA